MMKLHGWLWRILYVAIINYFGDDFDDDFDESIELCVYDNIYVYKYNGVFVRGKKEEYVVREQSMYKNMSIRPHDVVLDIGANIGCSARYFADKHAMEIHCFEPVPENYSMLELNTVDLPFVTLYKAAIVDDHNPVVDLYLSDSMSTTHSILPTRGRKIISVPCINFSTIVTKIKPTVIKIDIEGGEFELLRGLAELPKCVRVVGIEVHYTKPDAKLKAKKLRDDMAKNYNVIQPIKYLNTNKGWNTCVAIWERKDGK